MMQQHNTDQNEQTSQEEVLTYPFPLTDHSLELADPTIYERLQAQCPVARVRMPVGGEIVLLTRHIDVVEAWTDPRVGTIERSDGDIPRRGSGRGLGTGDEMSLQLNASDTRHIQIRRLVTQWFTVKAANALAPRVAR